MDIVYSNISHCFVNRYMPYVPHQCCLKYFIRLCQVDFRFNYLNNVIVIWKYFFSLDFNGHILQSLIVFSTI